VIQRNGKNNKGSERITTTTKSLIPNKLGQARNETQSGITEIVDLKDKKKSMIVIVKCSER
jgi:hypothetical protein